MANLNQLNQLFDTKTQAKESRGYSKNLQAKKVKKRKHFDPRSCVICGKKYPPASAGQKYCAYCRKHRVPQYRAEKFKLGTCINCKCKTIGWTRWFKKEACQKHKIDYYEKAKTQYNLRQQEAIEKRKHELKSLKAVNRKKQIIVYKCKRCHENAYPNRRYCPSCFTYMSNKVDSTRHSVAF